MRIGYKITDLIEDVRITLDMNRRDTSLLEEEDTDTLELDELIESKLCEGADIVRLTAPLDRIEPIAFRFTGREINEEDLDEEGRGILELPDDFLRLIVFQLDSWRRPVYEFLSVDDPRYELQWSKWSGLRGTNEKPVVALTTGSKGTQLSLEFFCGKPGDKVIKGSYLKRAEITEDSTGKILSLDERCYRDVVNKTAELVSISLGLKQI